MSYVTVSFLCLSLLQYFISEFSVIQITYFLCSSACIAAVFYETLSFFTIYSGVCRFSSYHTLKRLLQ